MVKMENLYKSDQARGTASFANKIAHDFLAADGVAAIWKLHLISVVVRNAGYRSAAQILLDAADVAEELWRLLPKTLQKSGRSHNWQRSQPSCPVRGL
jgi:hypothetical protein